MILVPAASPDDWKKRQPNPEEQRNAGHPAEALAARWHGASAFPPEVSELFCGSETVRDARLLLAIPEHQVELARGARASHLNLWLLARTRRGLLSAVIEAVGDEGFETKIPDRQREHPHHELWPALSRFLEIEQPGATPVRSRLLHCTATALLEARRFFARGAVVIAHSFSQGREGFRDFHDFVRVMGGTILAPGELVAVAPREGIELFFGWAQAPVLAEVT
jgi:hypothetical protein